MAKQPETTQEWLAYYERLEAKAYDNYQQTGMPRYDNSQYKYSVICGALRAKLREESDRDDEIRKRMRNKDAVVDRLYKNEYTKAEVIELLNNAVWW